MCGGGGVCVCVGMCVCGGGGGRGVRACINIYCILIKTYIEY